MRRMMKRISVVLGLLLLLALALPVRISAKEYNGVTSPTWSPDGKQIAFVLHQQTKGTLYVVGAKDSKPVKIADNAETPDWSPDGRLIAYAEQNGSRNTIFTIAPDGSQRTKIAAGYLPAWSHSGQQIAYVLNEALYVANADGSAPRRLLEDSPLHVWSYRWSPDGKRIAVATGGSGDNRARVAVVNPDGSGVRTVADGLGSLLSWSPDSRHIVFSGDCGPSRQTAVCLVDAEKSEPETVIAGRGEAPRWSPDGMHIAVVTNGGICLIDARGADIRCLTEPLSNDWLDPSAWSPDGKQILITRAHERKPQNGEPYFMYFEVLVVQADGSGFYPLPGGFEAL